MPKKTKNRISRSNKRKKEKERKKERKKEEGSAFLPLHFLKKEKKTGSLFIYFFETI
jgi:hypothetical protein